MRVVVLMGGKSSEREISLKTGKAVSKALKELGHEVIELDLTEDLPCKLEKVKPDKVFIALHGKYGEDGCVQGLLEVMGIPYTGTGVLGSAVSMDKDLTKKVLSFHGISTPKWLAVKSSDGIDWHLYPAIVKPASQGSSVGLYMVNDITELERAVRKVLEIDRKALIEEFIEGEDVTVGVLKGEALPPIRVLPKGKLYDYESKYTKGMTRYEIYDDDFLAKKLQNLTLKIADILDLKDFSRIDFRVDREGEYYFLEINTIPGMTELSLLPMACKEKGIDFKELINIIIS